MNIPFRIYKKLSRHYGLLNWWPTNTKNRRDEIMIGAILTQNTNWKNVEKALKNLDTHNCIDLKKIAAMQEKRLAILIRSSGYYNQKAKKLKLFAKHVAGKYGGSTDKLLKKNIDVLREELLSLHGIGPETADSIILYAAEKPSFVIDAYTKRIFSRIGIGSNSNYNQLQRLFISNLPKNTELFKQYHAVIVELGKNICKKKPLCRSCPLNRDCNYFKTTLR